MNYREFQGYKIFEDGSVLGRYKKYVQPATKNGRKEIKIVVEGERKNFMLARLMYWVFKGFNIDDKDLCIVHKDGDPMNCHIDNLELKHRRDLIQGEKHIKRAKLTDEQVVEIRKLYKGKAGSNQNDKIGYSLNDLAKMYGVTKANIAAIIRKESRNESEYKL